MTASEKLRSLLDERGVEWRERVWGGKHSVTTFWHARGVRWHYRENRFGELRLHADGLTPEQAIAATLGCGECKPMTYDNGYSMDRVEPGEYYEFWEPACACSECGELIPMRKFCPNCGAKIVAPTTNDVDAEVDA